MKGTLVGTLAAALLTTGCAAGGALSADMADWQGRDLTSVVAAWGPPATETSIAGQRVMVWLDRDVLADRAGPESAGVVCERMLAVAADGTITGWRWRGDACEAAWPARRPAARSAAHTVAAN